ncbi:MAG: acyltransferase family protein [Polyangiaceae bacterium]|nr:acyltransferase family protein [Polyangiaceae bacterium]MBK8940080.1 acyltransferase family protein [Polyangiaceae bacterium]
MSDALEPPRRAAVAIPRAPAPAASEIARALASLARVGAREVRPNDLDARDETFIADMIPLMNTLYDGYFRCETELAAEIPKGPVLIVANHNGMTGTPDMFCHMTAFWRRYGVGRLAYGLMHDTPFSFPVAGAWLNAAGAVAANPENAERALARGANVLVFPGGDLDACKPTRDRYKISFGDRRGFLRLAIRMRVPIVPVVSAGGHESLYIATRGEGIARALKLPERFRSNVFPLGVALPWGVVAGVPLPHLPPPVKIHTKILAPIVLDHPPSAANDARALDSSYGQVVGAMQQAMNELRSEGRHGLFPRGSR